MNLRPTLTTRRAFFGGVAASAAFFTTRGLFAEQLALTPERTEGPFYPDRLPLDTDNDLIIVNDSLTPAVGEITHLTGRILNSSGTPINNVTIEIWQCDANQVYLHTGDSESKAAQRDKNFQGFGRFTTASTGKYYFRTIKPVPYPGRPAPHIHVKLKQGEPRALDHPDQHRRPPRQRGRPHRARGARTVRPRAVDGRLQALEGIEDRRTDRELRHHPRPHSRRADLGTSVRREDAEARPQH